MILVCSGLYYILLLLECPIPTSTISIFTDNKMRIDIITSIFLYFFCFQRQYNYRTHVKEINTNPRPILLMEEGVGHNAGKAEDSTQDGHTDEQSWH